MSKSTTPRFIRVWWKRAIPIRRRCPGSGQVWLYKSAPGLFILVFITVFVASRISYSVTASFVIVSSVKIGSIVDYVGVIDNYAYVLGNDLGPGLFLNLYSAIVPNLPYEKGVVDEQGVDAVGDFIVGLRWGL